MKVLSIVSQKGGTGKTTLATHLSVEAERNGHTIALIDLDPQASAAKWGDHRDIRFTSGCRDTRITIETLVRNCKKQRGNPCDY